MTARTAGGTQAAMPAPLGAAFEWHVADQRLALAPPSLALLGLSPASFDGRIETLLDLMYPLDRDRFLLAVMRAPPEADQLDCEFRVLDAGGNLRWFSAHGELRRDAQRRVVSVLGALHQIPPQVAADRRIRAQQVTLFQLLAEDRLDSLPFQTALWRLTECVAQTVAVERVGVWALDAERDRLSCLDLYTASQDRHERGQVLQASTYPAYFAALAGSRAIAAQDARSDPRTREFSAGYLVPLGITSMLDATVRRHGRTVGVVCHEHVGPQRAWTLDEQQFAGSVADVVTILLDGQERADLVQQVQHQARYDALTALPNRLLLREHVDALGAHAGAAQALLLLDLDRFSEINDALGHDLGDRLLQAVAGRLRAQVPAGGLLARMGCDEFALLVPDAQDEARVVAFARRVQALVREPLDVDGVRLAVNCSVGIGLLPRHGRNASDLLRCADVALHDAKQSLRGCRLYRPERDSRSLRRLSLMHDLRAAVAQDQLQVLFQPKHDVRTRKLIGVEALCRWTHPQFGPIGPQEFIPLAEVGDLILDLTLQVIARSGTAWHAWRRAGLDLSVAVNLSARLLGDDAAASALLQQVRAAGVPPGRLEFEITESALMSEPDAVLAAMESLDHAGIGFALDDFGIGYSSLSHISRMPIRTLKIDRSFVQAMADDRRKEAIVHSAIQLGRKLGLTVVAEGVETESTLSRLADLQCPQAQGFLFGRAMAAEAIAP